MTWALGHLVTLMEPEDYDPALKKWSLATLPVCPRAVRAQADRRVAVAQAARGCPSPVALGGRADLCHRRRPRGRADLSVYPGADGLHEKAARRLWLSSLTESAIRDAFRRLRPLAEYDALYAAARCRSEADWVVGLNATRFYTVSQRASGVLCSVGRVQTPVLAMIVRRDDEIRAFKPEPFWELLTRYRGVDLQVHRRSVPQRKRARRNCSSASRVVRFTILGVDRKPERSRAAATVRPDRVATGHESSTWDVG